MKYQILTREELVLLEPFETELDEEELSQYLVSKGFYDKDFFCQYFLSGYGYLIQGEQLPTPQHHKEIWEYLDKKSDFNLIEPRGHGKTSDKDIFRDFLNLRSKTDIRPIISFFRDFLWNFYDIRTAKTDENSDKIRLLSFFRWNQQINSEII